MAYFFEQKFEQSFNLKELIFNCFRGCKRHIIAIFIPFNIIVKRNKKMLKIFGIMEVSITNVGDTQQQRLFWESYLLVYLTNKYCYPIWNNVVTYLCVKRDKGYVTYSAYWNWLQWKSRWFACLLDLVSDSLSPFYKQAYDILVGHHDTHKYKYR
jgi:hypothetical protein